MVSAATVAYHLLRAPPDKSGSKSAASGPTAIEEEAPGVESEEQEFIFCRQCRQVITKPDERISRQGAHRHTFANPHGLVFEIGCFRNIQGCGYAGEQTDEFTWFPGYHWRVCFCGMCLTHLGWVFNSKAGDIFHGLIVDRLIEPG